MPLIPCLDGNFTPFKRKPRIHRPHFNNLYASFMLARTCSSPAYQARSADPAIAHELAALARTLLASHVPPIFIDIPFDIPSTTKLVAHRIVVKRCPPIAQDALLTVWQAVNIQGLMLHRWEFVALRRPDQRPTGIVGFISDIVAISPETVRLSIVGEHPGMGGYVIMPKEAIALPTDTPSIFGKAWEWLRPPTPPVPPPPPPPMYRLAEQRSSSETVDLSLTLPSTAGAAGSTASIAESATVLDQDSLYKRPSHATLRPPSEASLAQKRAVHFAGDHHTPYRQETGPSPHDSLTTPRLAGVHTSAPWEFRTRSNPGERDSVVCGGPTAVSALQERMAQQNRW